MQMERSRRGLEMLDEGAANRWMEVRVAAQQTRQARGESAIAACVDQTKRADHLPTWAEVVHMMRRALAGDARVHRNPLRVLQTAFEVLCTRATGVRGQLVRSAKFEHVWPRMYQALAGGRGIQGTVLYNNRGDKTHVVGDASHSGWVPARNVLLCPSATLGLCLLYRFTRGERFPEVCATLDGKHPGHQVAADRNLDG
jgi:hypothetical protein